MHESAAQLLESARMLTDTHRQLRGGSLKAARTERLGFVKQAPEYQGLAPIQKRIVDHLARRYENPTDGAFPKHNTLAEKFGISRRSVVRHMDAIVAAGVMTKERRGRGAGTRGGRTSNAYRLNPDLIRRQMASVTQPIALPVTQPVTAEGTTYQVEAKQVEALPKEEQVEAEQVEEASATESVESETAYAVPTKILATPEGAATLATSVARVDRPAETDSLAREQAILNQVLPWSTTAVQF